MHDMMRADIDQKQRKTTVERLLDNVWVLVSLLLMIGFGFYLWWQRPAASNSQLEPNLAQTPLSLRDSEREWNRAMKKSEPERLYARATEFLTTGQTQKAVTTLQALQILVQDNETYAPLQEAVERRLTELKNTPNEFLEQQLTKANQLLENQELSKAQTLVASLSKLYGEEPRVRELIEKFNTQAQAKQLNNE